MKDCIFCKIVKGEIPCHRIYGDSDYLAFLDIYPNTKGMTLVIPKKHYPSDAFEMPKEAYINLMLISKKDCKTS
jgi:diadenosine tetraphosphate (Ap4A) HIT family hydrolase